MVTAKPKHIIYLTVFILTATMGYFVYVRVVDHPRSADILPDASQEALSPLTSEENKFIQGGTQPSKTDNLDWEVYRNEGVGIEFQYPKGWFVEYADYIHTFVVTNHQYHGSYLFYDAPEDYVSMGFRVIDRRTGGNKNNTIYYEIAEIEKRYYGNHNCLYSRNKTIGTKNVKEVGVGESSLCSPETTAHYQSIGGTEIIWFDENKIVIFNTFLNLDDDDQKNIYYRFIATVRNL